MPGPWITPPNVGLTLFGDGQRNQQSLDGVIDTGASVICVDSRIPKRLGLVAATKKRMMMADGREVLAIGYRAVMSVPVLEFKDWVMVFGVEMERPSTRVLIGRSFLKRYRVNYDGPAEMFHFYDASVAPVLNYLEDHDG